MKEKWDSKSRASKEGTKKEGEPEGEPPVDKMRFAFFIIMLNGIGVLLPWNMFITIAPNYYVQYWFTMNGTRTDYAKRFMSDLGIAAQTPNFLAGLINVMQIIGGSLMIRIAGPLTVNCVNVAVILILIVAQDPAEEAMSWFYFITMLIVVILNFSNGLYQNSVFGLTADFPAAYTNALIVGNNVCGTFISVLVILTTIAFPTEYKKVALIYFSISLAVLLLCEASLFSLTRLDFYKYYIDKGNRARAAEHASRPSLAQFAEAFKGCWQQLVSVFLVFFVTLAVFPAVLAGTTPNGKGEPWNSAIPRELYPGITVFLNFNLMAAIGSTTANFVQFPGPKLLIYPVAARLLFIPYFMLCNYNVEDRVMPVWFKNEWFFILGNVVMAFTSGYFSSLAMMYAPRVVQSSYAKTAGMAGALFLITGIMCGVAFVPVITAMVNNIG
ncbi:Nucleoside Transporter [Ancylostoma caninum]|uniref:Nucleoside Transporter n=1 Tax=Ancylostoma caninum TaxID=29170 RepID=A0A368FPD7_ANCCA|nr:Nucleoside Transporter [Ancylostoma caninum]